MTGCPCSEKVMLCHVSHLVFGVVNVGAIVYEKGTKLAGQGGHGMDLLTRNTFHSAAVFLHEKIAP